MPHAPAAVIYGMSGHRLTSGEQRLFSEVNPYGYILFARNCESPQQVKKLVRDLREVSGRERLPILIDQEGGRVARLKPPHWPEYPSAGAFAALYGRDREAARRAVYLNARLIAQDLYALGITVNCAPVADVPVRGAHDVIGDRAFGHDPEQVICLARAQATGLMDGGIVPVLKHIPGHGRAQADSHKELPVVQTPPDTLRATDFAPFAALANLPMGMTAHVVYAAIDGDRMATLSPKVIDLIREDIGFQGLLMSDDISMKALHGGVARCTREALAAGCDIVLHCNGEMKEMIAVAEGVTPLADGSRARAEAAMRSVGLPAPFDAAEARETVGRLLSEKA
ncbi:MAG: beta-N-acetylhexosaminidase [Pseudomonadota bacterium]|nr:beta-N-acetylhexosaminidase [Pseudomonadota bacterium]MDE3038012.1 beta-N-acetylhexosaminidase [Pseudomonadota bacterium]